MPLVYNISASQPFAETLVHGIIKKYSHKQFSLADIILLLPNRRSCKTTQEAFLRATNGKPTLLPKMLPIGDIGDEDFIFKSSLGSVNINLPPVISNTKRRLLLGKLIEKFQEGFIGRNKITTAQSVNLAIELASFLDEVQKQKLSFDNLHQIVPDELAKHWQITMNFMDVILKHWPTIVHEKNVIDISTYRNIALQTLAENWQSSPPLFPVIAAGSTGSIPATANLLKVIASLNNGLVILPGLDQFMDHESWHGITETHPQYALKNLLSNMDITRSNVQEWVTAPPITRKESSMIVQQDHILLRSKLISQIMLPATVSYKWQEMPGISDTAINGISKIVVPTQQDEARVIATIMRNTLESKGKTAALISNDQSLISRVIAILEKWDLQIDNTSGKGLSQITPCIFMRLIARMVDERISPTSLLACLKHPMACGGQNPVTFKKLVRTIEIDVLRGLYDKNGFSGIKDALFTMGKLELVEWIGKVEKILSPFIKLMQTRTVSFSSLVAEHIKVAEDLAATDETQGVERLWGRDEGEALSEFFSELSESAAEIGNIQPNQYSGILEALLIGKIYRPKYGAHPRLSIISPIEARMQSFDLCILGGLNEGTWPPAVESGPWIGRPMRKAFGLPMPERQIGQAAHDFVQALHTKEVILTRSAKSNGVATVPSRWLLQIETVLKIFGKEHLLEPDSPWFVWSNLLDYTKGNVQPCPPPQPSPPANTRPLEIAATQIEKLMRNPYAHYADKILRLRKLNPIDMEPTGQEFGIIIHKVIEQFVSKYDEIPGSSMLEYMLTKWVHLLKEHNISTSIQTLWQPRFEKIANDLIRIETQRRDNKQVFSEKKGSYNIILNDGRSFSVTARADRLELDSSRNLTIIDYKAKSAFSGIATKLLNGTLPQLPLEALVAHHKGFKDITGYPEHLEYWFMTSGNDTKAPIELKQVNVEIDRLLEITKKGIEELANIFSLETTPYKYCPDPENEPEFDDYAHLARKKEWS